MSKNKNISKKIPSGTIIQTRDEFIYGGVPKPKGKYANNNFYRQAVVIDTNKDDEIGIVKFVSKGRHSVKINNLDKKYNAYLEIFDDNGSNHHARRYVGGHLRRQTRPGPAVQAGRPGRVPHRPRYRHPGSRHHRHRPGVLHRSELPPARQGVRPAPPSCPGALQQVRQRSGRP